MIIEPAGPADAPAITALVNGAYRGESAERGWAHEAGLLAGQRTDEAMVRDLMAQPRAILLLRGATGDVPIGCVALAPVTAETWSIGLLTVEATIQAGGLGRRLLEAAETYALAGGADIAEMTVIHVRAALIAWYERRGYRRTGGERPFPYGDERIGQPLRDDLRFVVLEKPLSHVTVEPT